MALTGLCCARIPNWRRQRKGALDGLFLLAAISALGVVGFLVVWKRLNVALVKSEKSFLAADAKIRSELAVAHEEILRKTRMAQLGNLTATMAHELRNPLSGVRTAAFLVKKRLAEQNFNVAVPLERIDKSIARCDNVISQLLDFSRTGLAQKMKLTSITGLPIQ